MLYVDPAWWGLGVGRLLHAQAITAMVADRYRQSRLWTPTGAQRARCLYERTDGTEVGSVDGSTIALGLDLTVYELTLGS